MTAPAFTQTVTLVTRTKTGVDSYGSDAYGTAEMTVPGVFAPGSSGEVVQGGDVVTTQPTVYLPAGTNVEAVDAVLVAGVKFEVDGDPQDWSTGSPFTGWVPPFPVVVALRKVTG